MPDPESSLPDIHPPKTKTPITFNQQNNLFQVPPSIFDGLSPEQRLHLVQQILAQRDATDQRNFEWAKEQLSAEQRRSNLAIIVGSFLALGGFSLSGYLAMNGQSYVAVVIASNLAIILATVVSRKF